MARLRIGIAFELLAGGPGRAPGEPADADAEYEPEATIAALEGAVRAQGAEPVRLGRPHAILERLGRGSLAVDAVWNVAEGRGTRNREAWVPVLLEMAQIPVLGSDALTLSLSLDKAWCKDVVAAAGVPVAAHRSVESPAALEGLALPGPYPLLVKPRWEGTAKGIHAGSRVDDREALEREVGRIVRDYRQPALVEVFVPGAEYTVSVIGHAPPRVLPVLQRALELESGIGLHALERHAPEGALLHHLPGGLDAALEKRLEGLALCAFEALRCRDFARLDFKLDAEGEPRFLEINPLPTFAPEGSFGVHAELLGRSHEDLLAEVLGEALTRIGLRR